MNAKSILPVRKIIRGVDLSQALCQECLSSPDGTVKGAAAALSANQSVGKGRARQLFLIATRSKFTKLPPDKPQFHG